MTVKQQIVKTEAFHQLVVKGVAMLMGMGGSTMKTMTTI
jgi:hypothetical protein